MSGSLHPMGVQENSLFQILEFARPSPNLFRRSVTSRERWLQCGQAQAPPPGEHSDQGFGGFFYNPQICWQQRLTLQRVRGRRVHLSKVSAIGNTWQQGVRATPPFNTPCSRTSAIHALLAPPVHQESGASFASASKNVYRNSALEIMQSGCASTYADTPFSDKCGIDLAVPIPLYSAAGALTHCQRTQGMAAHSPSRSLSTYTRHGCP